MDVNGLTKLQAAEIALILSDYCNEHGDCDDCIFCTTKGCMLSDNHDQVLPCNWKVRQIDQLLGGK